MTQRLSHLTEDQRATVKPMLREEWLSFSRSDDDIGCIDKLQMSMGNHWSSATTCTMLQPLPSIVMTTRSPIDCQTKRDHRWMAELADFHFTIKYRPGNTRRATTSKLGKTAVNLIFIDFAQKFGFPSRIHHNQGEFENQLFSQLEKLSGVAGSCRISKTDYPLSMNDVMPV